MALGTLLHISFRAWHFPALRLANRSGFCGTSHLSEGLGDCCNGWIMMTGIYRGHMTTTLGNGVSTSRRKKSAMVQVPILMIIPFCWLTRLRSTVLCIFLLVGCLFALARLNNLFSTSQWTTRHSSALGSNVPLFSNRTWPLAWKIISLRSLSSQATAEVCRRLVRSVSNCQWRRYKTEVMGQTLFFSSSRRTSSHLEFYTSIVISQKGTEKFETCSPFIKSEAIR